MRWPTQEERFWSRVPADRSDVECWPWLGSLASAGGRGYVTWNGQRQPAYRVSWEIANGYPIPDGMEACHTCDNPACVNPAHIFIGTHRDNVRDAAKKTRLGRRRDNQGREIRILPPDLVAAAVDEYLNGPGTQRAVAAKYGVSAGTFSNWVGAYTRRHDAGLEPRTQARALAPCGTKSAYDRHLRRGEATCQPCREANAARVRQQKRQKAGAA